MSNNERRSGIYDRRQDHYECDVHVDFVKQVHELTTSIAVIGEGFKWIRQIGKWVIPTLITLSLLFGGSMVTLSIKVADLHHTVEKIETEILKGEKENG